MGDYLKDEYSKRDEEIENAELYALIEILECVKPIPLGYQPRSSDDWDKIFKKLDHITELLKQKIERRNKWIK